MSTAVENDVDLSDIHLFDIETLIDPWEAYTRLRDNAPVFFVPEMNIHVVTRYDLLMQAARDTETFSSGFGEFLNGARMQYFNAAPPEVQAELVKASEGMFAPVDTLLTADMPTHKKYRSQVDRVFTAGNVRKMEPYINEIIKDTIDAFIDADGPVDFMQAFAFPVPLRIIGDRLGVEPEDREFFNDAATVAAAGLRLTMPDHQEGIRRAKVMVQLQNYMVNLVHKRREDPKNDMATILGQVELEDEKRPLNDPELWSIMNQFLVAGHETTTSTFGWGMLELCKHPEVQEEIRGDKKMVRTFVEEALRLEAPVQGLPRVVTKDTELGGYPLKAGDLIMLRYGAANRDERQFECPVDLDVHRKNAGSQLAFGTGIHHCVGAPLARQELNLGFPALLDRMKNFRLAPGKPAPKAEPSFILRNLPELWIEFDRR
ncbi:MAG: cytochrome P450 [Alphaproteobacteria bacterium]